MRSPKGRIRPLNPPAKINSFTGVVLAIRKIRVETTMKPQTTQRSQRVTHGPSTFRNDVDVYEAPITDVTAADHKMTPKTISPVVPRACSNAEPAGFSSSSFLP